MPILTKGARDVILGVDYSSGRPNRTALKTAGIQFVCRYVGSTVHGTGRSAKWLTPAEAVSLHGAELDIVIVFETTAKRADGGRAAGLADAHTAVAELAYCGASANTVVYFAVDWDATVGPLITGYFQAIGEVLGLRRVGAYGGYKVIKALFDAHLITYGMQTYAWSAGRWDSRAQIQQYSNGRTLGGASVDFDRAMHADFGQWPTEPAPPPVTKPKPWPGRYLKLTSPLMHGSDVTWVQEHLNSHGASPKLKTDGQYGAHTRDAVKVFQHAKHLTVDGIVGRATWTALGKP